MQWTQARRAESLYNTRLRSVAKYVGQLVKGFAPDGVVKDLDLLVKSLEAYATLLTPWARSVASYMLADVNRRDEKLWRENSAAMGKAIRVELAQAPTGVSFARMRDEQVELIRSLPVKAAQRVTALAREAMLTSSRGAEVEAAIMQTGLVTEKRARLIARTEVAKSASVFTQARAQFAGSPGYIWRTVKDGDVRHTHQNMEGVYVPWGQPPKTDKNLAPYHAGQGPNCRCYAEPVLPDI